MDFVAALGALALVAVFSEVSAETSQMCKINRPAIKCNIFWQSPYLSVTESCHELEIALRRTDSKLLFSELGWTGFIRDRDYKLGPKCVMPWRDQGPVVIVPALCRHQTITGLINITKYGDTCWNLPVGESVYGLREWAEFKFNLYSINRLSDAFHNYILQIESS